MIEAATTEAATTEAATLSVSEARAAAPAAQAANRYPGEAGGRDSRIDLLRGFCVVAMIVDHMAGPSFLQAITGGNRFFTSAAEAFIFISGLVMGMAYQRLVLRDGLGPSLLRALQRGVTLYLVAVTLTLVFVPLSEALALHWAQGIDFSDPAAFVVSVLTLHRTYYLVDIPLLYALLLMVAPAAITMMSQGRTDVVLGVSWLLWAMYQFFPEYTDAPWRIAGNYLFYFSAWQVFFFSGLAIGWHRATLTRLLSSFPVRLGLVVAGVGFAALIALDRFQGVLWRLWPDDPERASEAQLFMIEMVFGKADVRPGRILASVVVFAFFYLLVTEGWRPIRRMTGWLLFPLGQNALYAYAAHVIVAIPLGIALQRVGPLPGSYFLNAGIQVLVLLLVLQCIRCRFLFVDPNRGWSRYAWPLGTTVACLVILPLDQSPRTPGVAAATIEADPYAQRVARAFGTPVPGKPPRGEGTPVPLPRPSLRPARVQGSPAVNPYIGRIQGTVLNVTFYSPALGVDMPYFIYLPPGYREEGRLYPTLFMLHGNSGSNEEWLAYGLVNQADRLIVARRILPLVIVLPQGDYSYWVNHPGDGPRWGDYLSVDLVRHIGATYRVFPDSDQRAVGGLSMGGTGALLNAFWNPQAFRVVGAHSPSLPEEGARDFLGEGREYAVRDPISVASFRPRRLLNQLSIWVDVGDEDEWRARVEQLQLALDGRDVDLEWSVFTGDHDGEYWSAHIVDYLLFYDAALNPAQASLAVE